MKLGRPSLFTQEIAEQIIEQLAAGTPLAEICRKEGMPGYRTVYDWMGKYEDFSAAIAHAREDGEDAIAADCLQIADDSRNDFIEQQDKEDQPAWWKFNGDHVQRCKLRIETRLKLLSKWNPKKYGDKIQNETDMKVEVIVRDLTRE